MTWLEEKDQLGKEIIGMLYDQGMIRTWYRDKPEGWTLVSGMWSPFYIQLRPMVSYSNSQELLRKVGTAMGRMIKEEAGDVNKIVGVAATGVPIATAITMQEGIPMCYTRKIEGFKTVEQIEARIKEYGEHSLVEGEISDGDVIALVDDLVSRFDSKLLALEQLKYEVKRREKQRGKKLNVTCKDVAVLFDREQGAAERARSLGMNLHSIIPFKSKGIDWLRNKMTEEERRVIEDYLNNDTKYQDRRIQKDLMKLAQKF